MKRFVVLSCCILLLLSFVVSVNASGYLTYIVDHADLLSDAEENMLEEEAFFLRQAYGYEVAILTLNSLNGSSIESIADNFYDDSGYSENGVVFVIAMAEREWYISTCGDAIYALTDFGISSLQDVFLQDLSSGWYYDAFHAYLQALPAYFDAFQNGTPIDGYADYSGDDYHGTREEVVYYSDSAEPNLLISMGVGLAAAAIVVLIMRSAMNTKRPQSSAVSYLKNGSYNLRTQQDLFLYSNISKVRRQENNSSGGGGGSSVHRSSSGRSHGGGGGKF